MVLNNLINSTTLSSQTITKTTTTVTTMSCSNTNAENASTVKSTPTVSQSMPSSNTLNKLTKMLQNTKATAVPQPSCITNKMLSNEDKKINLNALKNHDPFATNILDMAIRVAVYKFMSKKNEWKKLDVEGSLFIFERMVEPLHSFVVMNTLALNLFLQPITSDLEFQDRNPFLLYKSNNGTKNKNFFFFFHIIIP